MPFSAKDSEVWMGLCLFPVREAGEECVFLLRQTGFFFFRPDGTNQKRHVPGQIAHGLQAFQILFHIVGRKAVHLVPVSAGNDRHARNGEILVQYVEGCGVSASPAADNGGTHLGEWGFVGMVETDYDGSYGYMISDHCVRNGNDLMLGFAGAASNQFTDQSATATLAMRNACKNILYTIGNSGYYANGAETSGMDNMTKLFVGIDAGIGVLILALAAIVFGRYFSKKKKAKAA